MQLWKVLKTNQGGEGAWEGDSLHYFHWIQQKKKKEKKIKQILTTESLNVSNGI